MKSLEGATGGAAAWLSCVAGVGMEADCSASSFSRSSLALRKSPKLCHFFWFELVMHRSLCRRKFDGLNGNYALAGLQCQDVGEATHFQYFTRHAAGVVVDNLDRLVCKRIINPGLFTTKSYHLARFRQR